MTKETKQLVKDFSWIFLIGLAGSTVFVAISALIFHPRTFEALFRACVGTLFLLAIAYLIFMVIFDIGLLLACTFKSLRPDGF